MIWSSPENSKWNNYNSKVPGCARVKQVFDLKVVPFSRTSQGIEFLSSYWFKFLSQVWESLSFLFDSDWLPASCMNREVLFPTIFHPSHSSKSLVCSRSWWFRLWFCAYDCKYTRHRHFQWVMGKKPALGCCYFTCRCESWDILENWMWWHSVDCWGSVDCLLHVFQNSRISWRCISQNPVHNPELPGQGNWTGIFLCVTEKFACPNFTHLLHFTCHKPAPCSHVQKLVFPGIILNSVHLQRKNAKYF